MKAKNERKVPAIIISRCLDWNNDAGIIDEFDGIPESLYDEENRSDGLRPPVLLKAGGGSVQGRTKIVDNILWLSGTNLVYAIPEFKNLLSDPEISYDKDRVIQGLRQLIGQIGTETKIEIRGELLIILHPGGDHEMDYYERLHKSLTELLSEIDIKTQCRFTSTNFPFPEQSEDIHPADIRIPASLVGLTGDARQFDISQFQKYRDTPVCVDQRSQPLFDKGLLFEKEVILPDHRDSKLLIAKIKSTGKELGEPFSGQAFQSCLIDFFNVDGETASDENTCRIYRAQVSDSKGGQADRNAKIIETSISPDTLLSQAIKKFCAPVIDKDVVIVYLSLEILRKGNFHRPFCFDDKKDARPAPRIFITVFDLISMANPGPSGRQQADPEFLLRVFGRFRFFDSCVWFRMAPIYADPNRIKDVFEDIKDAFNRNVFNILQALESRELMIRTFNQSYVLKMIEGDLHGERVTPWVFHSEYLAKRKLKALQRHDLIQRLNWRFLLIDDHAGLALNKGSQTKGQFIDQLLNKIQPRDPVFRIEASKTNVKDAVLCLKEAGNRTSSDEWYDVILIDYLLIRNNRSEFGDEIIKELYHAENFERGPLNKTWFFPISVYANTIHSKLHEAGIQAYSDRCVVTAGADPICTPNLFLQNLLETLKMQVIDLFRIGEDINVLTGEHPIITYLSKIVENENIKNNARASFPEVVILCVIYERIINWLNKSSFSKSIYEMIFKKIDLFEVEQFRDVLYLLAFGNINDKNKLWGEWTILKDILYKPNLIAKGSDNIKTRIEKYISGL